MTEKTNSISFNVPIYDIEVHVGRDYDVVRVDGADVVPRGEQGAVEISGSGWSNFSDSKRRGFIAIQDHSDRDFQISCLAHECLHVMNRIFNNIGYQGSRVDDEADAYLLGYLIENAIKALRQYDESNNNDQT